MTDEEKIRLAQEAEFLLKNEIFLRVMNMLDVEYHALWREAVTVEAREDLHRYVKLTEKFTQDIIAIVKDGKFAEERKRFLEGKPNDTTPKDFAQTWLTPKAA